MLVEVTYRVTKKVNIPDRFIDLIEDVNGIPEEDLDSLWDEFEDYARSQDFLNMTGIENPYDLEDIRYNGEIMLS